jgi:3-deoxy-D-manno-octulosonate 8-phosphate phosphatase (KDO 8-P phosphatase)
MNIAGLVLDVDGVLTDGTFVIPIEGDELKAFHSCDGLGLRLLMDAGVKVAFLSGRRSGVVERRARELGVHKVVQGKHEKVGALREIAAEFGCALEDLAYMGDDLVDLAPMKAVGLAAAPSDARPEARDAAVFVAASAGGRGAVRDLCEHLLREMGRWDEVRARFGA